MSFRLITCAQTTKWYELARKTSSILMSSCVKFYQGRLVDQVHFCIIWTEVLHKLNRLRHFGSLYDPVCCYDFVLIFLKIFSIDSLILLQLGTIQISIKVSLQFVSSQIKIRFLIDTELMLNNLRLKVSKIRFTNDSN